MEVYKIAIENFNIGQIADSGQCFRMNRHPSKPNTYVLIANNRYIEIEQNPNNNIVCFHGVSEQEFKSIWFDYFDLSTDYSKIIASIDKDDEYLQAAVNAGSGIRILHQNLWETMVSFIISQNNNIPRIKSSIEKLCETCGTKKVAYGNEYYCFPTPEQLSIEENLKPARLGYRERYLLKLSNDVLSGNVMLAEIKAKEQLLKICGIGEKVANCIMLFGLHDLTGFPIDVWIKRVIDLHYNGNFPIERYSGYAGVIQQYIFNYAIQNK